MKFIYRLLIGRARIRQAQQFCAILQDSTCNLGSFGYNYNPNGERIRDRVTKTSIDRRHPLQKKYE